MYGDEDPSKQSFSFFNKPIKSAASYLQHSGSKLYEYDQLNVANLVMRLWRKIAYKHDITFEYHIQRYQEYCRDVLGKTAKEINRGVGNLKSPLYRKKMTFSMLSELANVIGKPIQNITIDVMNEDGTIESYSALDVVEPKE